VRALLFALFACGCGPGADPAVARLADVELGVRAINRGVGVTTAFIGTAVIDANATPEIITNALAQYFKSNTNNCGTVTTSGTMLDADLSVGCTLGTANMLVKGTVHADLSVTGKTVTILFKPNVTVDGDQQLTGTVRVDTGGSLADIDYRSDLRLGAAHVTTIQQHAGVAANAATLQTPGTLDGETVMGAKITAASLTQRFAGCYPSEGTLKLVTTQEPATDETFVFDSNTNGTGNVVRMGDNKVLALPTRTNCPRM
jgi:hypothetical protein